MWPFHHPEEEDVPVPLNDEEEIEVVAMGPEDGFPDIPADTDSGSEADDPMHGSAGPIPNDTTIEMMLTKSLRQYRMQYTLCVCRQSQQNCSSGPIQPICQVYTRHGTSPEEEEEERSESPPIPVFSRIVFPRRHQPFYLDSPSDNDSSSDDSDNEGFRFLHVPHSGLDGRSSPGVQCELPKPIIVKKSALPSDEPCPDYNPYSRRRLGYTKTLPRPNLLARQAANRIIKHARYAKNAHEEDLYCLSCGLFPNRPITGKCGHTRCKKCIEKTKQCPCGGGDLKAPSSINILIRNLIEKTLTDSPAPRIPRVVATSANIAVPVNSLLFGSSAGPIRAKRRRRQYVANVPEQCRPNVPMSMQARFSYAMELLSAGKHKDAAPHLAIAAASLQPEYRVARPLLAQVIMMLSNKHKPFDLTKELSLLVRGLSAMKKIEKDDMECILCCDVFTKPVTTPCGHMFCRTCLEKAFDFRKRCPLCLRRLNGFKLNEVSDTVFIRGALAEINSLAPSDPNDDKDLVPIFVCTVAYPSIACPLYIFDPRYWMMIRRVLESGSRQFGMVPMDKDKKYADYGTILEVRDCVQFEDGRSIVSTIGLSRFKVMERCVRDGYEVARIQQIRDVLPRDPLARHELRKCAQHVVLKTIFWLSQLHSTVLYEIETAFGTLPSTMENVESLYHSIDGPAWLWWLVAVLPLRTEIKVLILSTDRLLKRMRAIVRTFEAMEHIKLTTIAPGGCTN